jgi:hypothetical protein
MRTANPNSIRDDFVAALADVRTTFISAENSNIAGGGKKLITEFSFLSAAILLEGYISDLFVAYINRDDTAFAAHLVGHMKIETNDPFATEAKGFASISIRKHLTTAEIRSVLDSKDYNVTFPTVAAMKAGAGKWLSNADKLHFHNISAAHGAVIEATKAIRNFLAHRSPASKATMQNALTNAHLPADLRRGQHQIKDAGSFLRAKPTPPQPHRLALYLTQLEQIATSLCP